MKYNLNRSANKNQKTNPYGISTAGTTMKNILLICVLFGLLFAGSLKAIESGEPSDYSLQIGDWRTSHETLKFNMAASMTHFAGSAYIANILEERMDWWKADLATLSLGLLWEVKDGYVPWEQVGGLGGEGFSTNDFKMDLLGVALNRLMPIVLEKAFSTVQNFNRSNYSLGFSGQSYPKVLFSLGI